MSATADDSPATQHAGLQDLFSYPLTSALQDRRTRRVAQGVSLKHGAQPYESPNAPSPLTPLEEAVLIASTSLTGAVMHDGPTAEGRRLAASSARCSSRSPAARPRAPTTRRRRRSS